MGLYSFCASKCSEVFVCIGFLAVLLSLFLCVAGDLFRWCSGRPVLASLSDGFEWNSKRPLRWFCLGFGFQSDQLTLRETCLTETPQEEYQTPADKHHCRLCQWFDTIDQHAQSHARSRCLKILGLGFQPASGLRACCRVWNQGTSLGFSWLPVFRLTSTP